MNLHLASASAPGTRLVVAIAPAFTIGFVRPSSRCSIAASELNGSPVPFTPSFVARCFRAEHVADQREDERLGHAHDRELVLRVAGAIDVAAGPDDADAEQIARHRCQRRIDLRVLPFVVRLEALVCLDYERSDTVRVRKAAG